MKKRLTVLSRRITRLTPPAGRPKSSAATSSGSSWRVRRPRSTSRGAVSPGARPPQRLAGLPVKNGPPKPLPPFLRIDPFLEKRLFQPSGGKVAPVPPNLLLDLGPAHRDPGPLPLPQDHGALDQLPQCAGDLRPGPPRGGPARGPPAGA